ncbi:VOC family protein [Gryllotalpicola koreensis]|uniref:VOC domain-containing protein n=1 Tax=Gryllotalpicola koreensis TaxID=993086 RepID=A0ABP7ZY78_9MICO
MEITHAVLATRALDETADFYERVLGLHVAREPGEVTVAVGASVLVFQQDADEEGCQHLAFTIPTGSFAAARRWLESRVSLLGLGGVDEFEGPPSWNSMSLYFEGPDGSILELIERRDLDNAADAAAGFGPEQLLCVSEVGVAVPDVLDTAAKLAATGIEPYANPPGEAFAPVGDVRGLIILVSPGRAWFPTQTRLAAPGRVKVGLAGGRVLRF